MGLRVVILASLLLSQAAALGPAGNLALRGGAAVAAPCKKSRFNRKTFKLGSCLQDHVELLKSIPKILDGYVGPNKIDPEIGESCMAAVNSVNNCPFCTSIHGELGRMAGLGAKQKALDSAKTAAEVKKIAGDNPMVVFARKFAENDGRGADVEAAFKIMEKAVGTGKAEACRAHCWFLHWGSTCGNTILSFYKGRLCGSAKCGSNPFFEIAFAM
jgi:AhpD family alkylhydroperoxidase